MLEISCAKARAALTSPPELLTAGMAKVVTVHFAFSPDWDGLRKTAVFSDGWRTVDVLESAWTDGCVPIPHEVLQTAGRNVRVGVYGSDSTGVALPTVWAELGRVRPAADPSGDTSTDPTAPVWSQLQGQIGDLDKLTTTDKSTLVAAINEAARSGGGGGGSAVLYTEQNLTAAQQEQARANINASSNYARECSHLWFVRDNGEHYRDIVTAARSGGNPVVIRESDWSGTTFIAPAIAVIGDYGSQNPSVPYPITIFSADGTMWFTEIYNLYGQYPTTPRMTELRRIDTAETDVLHVTLTTGDDNVDTSDTTAAAVQEALAAGKVVTVTIGDSADVWLLLSAVEGATTGSYDMQLVSVLGVILYTANGTQWTRTLESFGGLATLDYVYASAVSLGGMSGAAAGQIAKITEVDDNGTPLAWEPVDMPSGGSAETWELIASGEMSEAATLSVNKDANGNAFSLKSCTILVSGALSGGRGSYVRFAVTASGATYFVETSLTSENMNTDARFTFRQGDVPTLTMCEKPGTAWQSGTCTVQMALRESNNALAAAQGAVSSLRIGPWSGTAMLGAGCKYALWGVRA